MITLYTGTCGSGKSVHQAQLVYWQLKLDKPCVCNYDVNREMFPDVQNFHYLGNDELTPQRLQAIAADYFKSHRFREGAIKLFVDECQVMFGNRSGEWKTQERKDWNTFFQQHRKMGYDIFLICQQHEMIDKQIRGVIEYEVSHRKVNNVGWFGKLVSVCTLGTPVFCAVTSWYGQRMRLSAEWFVGRKKFYDLYDSYKVFQGAEIMPVSD